VAWQWESRPGSPTTTGETPILHPQIRCYRCN